MTDTQKYLLSFIKFFDGFCRDNGIEYFLGGGSLLGAVRHGGFLPWDDDMDLYIKGSEWNRIREIFEKKLPERYKIVSNDTHPDYHNTIIRICDTYTSAYYKSRLADNTPHGVQIELFRLDPMPDDPQEARQFYNDYWVYYEAENPYIELLSGAIDMRKLSYDDFVAALRLFDSGNKEATDRLEASLYRWSEQDVKKYHEGWATYWLEYPIEAFSKQIYMPFEDTELPVPVGFADVLYGEYGDNWMELPSVANQAFHDDYEDYDIPYSYMEKEIASQIDIGKYLEAYRERKRLLVERDFIKENLKRKRLEAEDKMVYGKYNTAANKEFCAGAFSRRDYRAVLDRMKGYINRQWDVFSGNFIYTIDPDLWYQIIYSSFMEGELKFIDRIERNLETEAEPRIKEIFDDLRELRVLRFAYYYGTMDEYRERYEALRAKYPDQVHLGMLGVLYRINAGDDPESVLEDIHRLEEAHGPVHRIRKLEADMLIRAGRSAEGMELYRDILDTSNDGMVNNEIRAILAADQG